MTRLIKCQKCGETINYKEDNSDYNTVIKTLEVGDHICRPSIPKENLDSHYTIAPARIWR